MKPFIRTAYDDGDYVHAGLDFVDPHTGEVEKSLTDQSQMDDCDINILMQRYGKSGVVVVNSKPAAYGDITDVKSFQEAKNIFIQAEAAFASLDAKVRKEFDNDPVKFLDFMENLDDSNKDTAIRLGLITEPRSLDPAPEEVKPKDEA